MPTKSKTFPPRIVEAIRKAPVIGIRIGTEPHRIIAVWAVVVAGRVFVRSWSLKPEGWYRTSLLTPRGTLQILNRLIPVRTVRPRSSRLKDAVSLAYKEKYHTPGSVRYVKDLSRQKSRDTTTELVPIR
ncbi:MAG TPA: DUF2255 family protein [Bacteroidota bacterium]